MGRCPVSGKSFSAHPGSSAASRWLFHAGTSASFSPCTIRTCATSQMRRSCPATDCTCEHLGFRFRVPSYSHATLNLTPAGIPLCPDLTAVPLRAAGSLPQLPSKGTRRRNPRTAGICPKTQGAPGCCAWRPPAQGAPLGSWAPSHSRSAARSTRSCRLAHTRHEASHMQLDRCLTTPAPLTHSCRWPV